MLIYRPNSRFHFEDVVIEWINVINPYEERISPSGSLRPGNVFPTKMASMTHASVFPSVLA